MIHPAEMRSQTRNRPRRQFTAVGSLACGLNGRRGMLYSGIDNSPGFNRLIRSEDRFRTAHLSQRAASSQSRLGLWNRYTIIDADPRRPPRLISTNPPGRPGPLARRRPTSSPSQAHLQTIRVLRNLGRAPDIAYRKMSGFGVGQGAGGTAVAVLRSIGSKVCLRRALFTTGPGPDNGGSMP
jgi:hypothetical protein